MSNEVVQSVLKLILSLPAVVLLAYFSLRLSNKYLYGKRGCAGMQVLERVCVGGKSALCIVRIFDDYLVIGISENNIQPIKALNREEAENYLSGKAKTPGSGDWFKDLLRRAKGEKAL